MSKVHALKLAALNSAIKIDKQIPIPSAHTQLHLPFAALEVGESFFVAEVKITAVQSGKAYYGRKLNREYTTRSVTEDGVSGVRVWRTA